MQQEKKRREMRRKRKTLVLRGDEDRGLLDGLMQDLHTAPDPAEYARVLMSFYCCSLGLAALFDEGDAEESRRSKRAPLQTRTQKEVLPRVAEHRGVHRCLCHVM